MHSPMDDKCTRAWFSTGKFPESFASVIALESYECNRARNRSAILRSPQNLDFDFFYLGTTYPDKKALPIG